MKKFLVILMVVAMASFIFVGCLPTTNTAPVFTSTAGTTATVGTEYSYTPTATDANAADTVTFAVAGPTSMAISAGVITWTPTTAQIGTHSVIVTADDGTDATAQAFTITVSAAADTSAAIAAVNEALSPAALNIALADAAFTGYTAANYTYYNLVDFSTTETSTVVLINAAIVTANKAAATAAVADYTTSAEDLTTDTLIVAAVDDTTGLKATADAAVAALPAGTVKTAHLATIAANDLLITTAARIDDVTVDNVTFTEFIKDKFVAVTAVAVNAADITLTSGVTYAWTVATALNTTATTAHLAVIADLNFSSQTKSTVITYVGTTAADTGDSYTIKVVATKGGIPVSDTATVVDN